MTKTEQTSGTLQSSTNISISATNLVAVFGFSCYLIWEYFGIFDTLPFLSLFSTNEELAILKPATFFFLTLEFVVVSKIERKKALPFSFFFSIAIVSSFACLMIAFAGSFLAQLSFQVGLVAWIAYGISLTSWMFVWALYFTQSDDEGIALVVVVSYALAFLVFLLFSATAASQVIYLFAGLLLIAGTLITSRFLMKDLPYTSCEPRIVPQKYHFTQVIHSGSYGVIYGFVLAFLFTLGSSSAYIGAAGGLLGCILAWYLFKKDNLSSSTHLRRVTFAPVVIAVLFLPLGGYIGSVGCSLLVLSATICTAIASWVITFYTARTKKKLDPVLLFSKIKIPGWAGFFLGTLIGNSMLAFEPDFFPLIATILAALICLSFSAFEMKLNALSSQGADESVRHFQSRCARVISIYHLSPREGEVFYLLAKGRNAKHISQMLCIAKPTTKTHIRHIYQKLGINSHQELIDLFDTVSSSPFSEKKAADRLSLSSNDDYNSNV